MIVIIEVVDVKSQLAKKLSALQKALNLALERAKINGRTEIKK
jgi:hypothetical protein